MIVVVDKIDFLTFVCVEDALADVETIEEAVVVIKYVLEGKVS